MNMRRQRDVTALKGMREVDPHVPFRFAAIDSIQRSLHDFDRANVGSAILSALGNPDAKLEYQIRQLIEEAISASEIEGARPTTGDLARQLLRERRPPTSRDEKMIVNNLRAMERLSQLHRAGEPLTIEPLLELHKILGENALEIDGTEGQFRTSEHRVEVSDMDGNVWHTTPPAEGLEERERRLLVFANCEDDAKPGFVHPIIRAIVVHFWLGYEHPFRDGNGRIARALYYWCMLKSGYDVAEFLSISGPIARNPNAYYKAFASSVDDGDLTYFSIHQLEVMRVALEERLEHLRERAARLRAFSLVVASFDQLNYRQRSMLDFAIRHPRQGQTIESYRLPTAISPPEPTARRGKSATSDILPAPQSRLTSGALSSPPPPFIRSPTRLVPIPTPPMAAIPAGARLCRPVKGLTMRTVLSVLTRICSRPKQFWSESVCAGLRGTEGREVGGASGPRSAVGCSHTRGELTVLENQ
jgi:Fic family protein